MAWVDEIRKFVEEDYKDCAIFVTCDNQHLFWDHIASSPDLIWDWDNETLVALELNDELVDQSRHPLTITMTHLSLIQFISAYPNRAEIIDFINKNYSDDEKKKKALALLHQSASGMMRPDTLRKNINDPEYYKNLNSK